MRLASTQLYYQSYPVSIHASVKDATDEDGNAYKVDFVSIHASVKDATVTG